MFMLASPSYDAVRHEIPAGTLLYHCSVDPVSLVTSGFDPARANSMYRGAFFFADRKTYVANTTVGVNHNLRLLRADIAIEEFLLKSDPYWPNQRLARYSGYDGTFNPELFDACTEYEGNDGTQYCTEIVIFKHSLAKLGEISLITPGYVPGVVL